MKTMNLFGREYTVRHCTLDDVDRHYDYLREFVLDLPEEQFRARMVQAIEQKTAFCLVDDGAMLYYINHKPELAEGVILFSKTSPRHILGLMACIFTYIDTTTFSIKFNLHESKFAAEYKSLLTRSSIRKNVTEHKPLHIRVDHLKKKLEALHYKRLNNG